MSHQKTPHFLGRPKDKFLVGIKKQPWQWVLGYLMAAVAVALGFGLRLGLTAWVGPGLPTYVTFYPGVMLVALLAGFGPGLLATALTALIAAYWILPPEGFAVNHPVDLLGLGFFTGMGLFLTAMAELYRRKTTDLIEQRRQQALRESEEHRKMAEAVQAERQRFHDVLEMLPAYVVLLSPDYHVPFANRFFRERFGKSNGKRCYEYLFQRNEPCEKCESFLVLKTKTPHHWEWTGPDGRNYDIHDFPFTEADGSLLILEMGIDITEIKRAQAALQEANETLEQRVSERTAALFEAKQRLQAIMQAVPVGISFSDDVSCQQITGNPAMLAQFEIQPADNISASALDTDAPGRRVRYFHNSGQLTAAELPLQRAVAENRLIPPMELEIEMPSGRRWFTEASGAPILNGQGQVIGGLAVTVDITQRKEAQAKIDHQNRVLKAINRIFREALACKTEEQLGCLCLAVAEEATSSKFGFIGEVNVQTGLLDDIAISDPGWKGRLPDQSGQGKKVPKGFQVNGLFGQVVRDGKGFFTNDPASHPATIGTPESHPPLTAFLGVPLMQEGKTIGLVAVANREDGYCNQDQAALEALAEPIVQVLMRRRAQQALRQAKEDWEQTFNTVPDLVAILDNKHRVVRANRAMVDRLGATLAQCPGQPCFAIVHRKAQPPENCPHTQTCRNGREHSAEVYEESLGGYFLVTTTPLFDDQGQVTGAVHVARDITPFKKAEDLLRTRLRLSGLAQTCPKEELVQTALDEAERHTGSTMAYFHFVEEDQENLRLNAWSSNTRKHLCQAEGQGQHYPISQAGVWVDCLHARAPVIHNDYASLPHKKGLPDGHAPVVRHLGVPVLRSNRVVAIMGVGNKPTDYTQEDANILQELASLAIDLVAFKNAEEAQRASETRSRLLVEQAVDGIFVSDAQGYYRDVNSAGAGMLGYTPEEILGLTIADVISEDEAPRLAQEVAKLAGGQVARSEWRFRRKNGSCFPGEVMARQLPDGRLQAILRDVTERKKAEEGLRASLHEKEVLLKEIHHRVKNNLQVISSLVSLQADGLQDPALRSGLQDMRDRVRSMALVHEKLYQSENLAQVEFADYARSLLNYLWRVHGTLAAQVHLNMDLQAIRLSVEKAVPCGLILNELAGNALKHAFRKKNAETPKRGGADQEVSFEVRVELRAVSNGRVALRVRDNGTGLAPEVDWRQGSSLGLRLVQMLTGQLGGTIEVRTSDGTGTEFQVTFETAS